MKHILIAAVMSSLALVSGCGTCMEEQFPTAHKAAGLTHQSIDEWTVSKGAVMTVETEETMEPVVYRRHRQWPRMHVHYQNIGVRHPWHYNESYYQKEVLESEEYIWSKNDLIAFGIAPAEYLWSVVEWPIVMSIDHPWQLERDRSEIPLQEPAFEIKPPTKH